MTDLKRLIDQFHELCGRTDFPKSPELGNFPTRKTINLLMLNVFPTFPNFPLKIRTGQHKTHSAPTKRQLRHTRVAHANYPVRAWETYPIHLQKQRVTISHSLIINWEKKEKWEMDRSGRTILDMNEATLQHESVSNPDGALPISSVEVHAGIERELRVLAVLGRTGSGAKRDAVEITRAKIRNSPALIERQPANGRCHVCQEALDDSRPEIAILQPKPGDALHMHAHCHAEHMRRRSDMVDRIMAAAGFVSEAVTRGAAVLCEGFASWCAPAREGESQ